MTSPTREHIERLMLETEHAREALRRKCQELKDAIDAVLIAETPQTIGLRPKPDRRQMNLDL
ncbi:MAG TPA: hypothetical protein VK504_03965 [Vicinamibacterales bacterium]|nr:hypothetical protein [Vicinamibacterales bacterium]